MDARDRQLFIAGICRNDLVELPKGESALTESNQDNRIQKHLHANPAQWNGSQAIRPFTCTLLLIFAGKLSNMNSTADLVGLKYGAGIL